MIARLILLGRRFRAAINKRAAGFLPSSKLRRRDVLHWLHTIIRTSPVSWSWSITAPRVEPGGPKGVPQAGQGMPGAIRSSNHGESHLGILYFLSLAFARASTLRRSL
jgi:hypothetical protein